jgi:hypothetical protein
MVLTLTCKTGYGALISFSEMESALAFFRSRELLVLLSAQKNKEGEYSKVVFPGYEKPML